MQPCLCVYLLLSQNVVRNQEAFDHSYTAQQGETNSAAHKVCFCYHTQYVQNILLRCLCIYSSSCYQNVVQNKETLLQNVRTQQGEKTFTANKVVSFHNRIHIYVQTIVLNCLFAYYFFFAIKLLSRLKNNKRCYCK